MIKQTKLKSNESQTLTPEELKEFKEAYESYQKAIYDLGNLDLEISKLKKRTDELTGEKIDLVSHIGVIEGQQQILANQLGDKYGMKTVDLETGELS
jgi:hypothetical protein